jgi:peptidoglycan/LPS O-acetylase OafA/YrhL
MTPDFPKMNRPARYGTLDAWRGLACLLVIVFHSTQLAGEDVHFSITNPASWALGLAQWMWIGVPMFFVISGYCIAAAADANRRRWAGVREYALRRFKRIFPPYWCAMALAVVAVAVEQRVAPGLWQDKLHGAPALTDLDAANWLGTLTLTEGWRPQLAGGDGVFFLSHAWTLGYEEQFYAVTGLLLLISGRWFFALTAAVSAIVVVVCPYAPDGFFFDGYWLQFAAGVAVYYAAVYGSTWKKSAIVLLLASALAWSCRDLRQLWDHHDLQMFAVAYAFALMLLLLRRLDDRLATSWLLTPLTVSGQMCYSLYLVHWPIVRPLSHWLWNHGLRGPGATCLVTLPLCLAASLVMGRLFYVCVERRFLNNPTRRGSFSDRSEIISIADQCALTSV